MGRKPPNFIAVYIGGELSGSIDARNRDKKVSFEEKDSSDGKNFNLIMDSIRTKRGKYRVENGR